MAAINARRFGTKRSKEEEIRHRTKTRQQVVSAKQRALAKYVDAMNAKLDALSDDDHDQRRDIENRIADVSAKIQSDIAAMGLSN